ncbi:hypothetical protein BS78_09G095900 [Paspalum vaginatum]|nr:hypothetical protein BS78_09G095900 [Paspalum vaginatum]
MCRNKWDELKKKWSCWKYLHTFSGLGYHPRTGVIQMPKAWWDARIKEKKISRVFKRIRLQREEDLDFIFAGMDPVNIGPNEDGGCEGGRAGVPTQHVDSDNSVIRCTLVHLCWKGSNISTKMYLHGRNKRKQAVLIRKPKRMPSMRLS